MIKYCIKQTPLFDIESIINYIKDFLHINEVDLLVIFDNNHRRCRGELAIARTLSGPMMDCARDFKFQYPNGYIMTFCPSLSECSQIEREWVFAHEFGHLLDAVTKPVTYEIGIQIQKHLTDSKIIPNNHTLPLERSADLTAKRIILNKYTFGEFNDLMHNMSTTRLQDSWQSILDADISVQYDCKNAIIELYQSNRDFLFSKPFRYINDYKIGEQALEIINTKD